jgi:hypothetical protein
MRSAESLRFMGMEHTIPETMRSSICPGCVWDNTYCVVWLIQILPANLARFVSQHLIL